MKQGRSHQVGDQVDQAAPSARPAPRKNRKLTPEVDRLIASLLGNTPAYVVDQVRQQLGVTLSTGTVYKVWQRLSTLGTDFSAQGTGGSEQKFWVKGRPSD